MYVIATELKNRPGRYLEAAQVEPGHRREVRQNEQRCPLQAPYDQLCRLEDMSSGLRSGSVGNYIWITVPSCS